MSRDAAVAKGAGPSTGLFSKKRMELSMTVSDVDVLLHPTPEDEGEDDAAPGNGSGSKTVIVHVALSIPDGVDPPDRISNMTVDLRSDEALGFPSGTFEKNSPHEVHITVDSAKDMPLARNNVYRWDVPLAIAHRSAPYERGVYGRLFHKVVVTLHWAGWSGWWKGGRNMVAEQLLFMAAASRDHSVLNYARTLHGHARGLGPIVFHVRTRHMSVGGYLRIALSLPRAEPHLDIHALHATMIQSTTLHSRQDAGKVEHCQPERMQFWKVSGEMLAQTVKQTHIQEESSSYDDVQGEWTTRFPNDSQIRPSTLAGSQAAIRHEHSIELKVAFRRDGELVAYTTRWPVTIAACGMLWRSVKLPSYSEEDPCPVPEWRREDWEPDKYPNVHVSQTLCACGQSLDTLLTWEREGDAEQNTVTSDLLHDAIRAASAGVATTTAGGRPSSRSRSRSRNRSAATSRSVSRRPSLDVLQGEEEFDSDGDDYDSQEDNGGGDDEEWAADEVDVAEEQARLRRRQKEAQMYAPAAVDKAR